MHRPLLILVILSLALPGCGGTDPPEATKATANWVMQLGGSVRLPGKTQNVKSVDELPEEGYQIERVILNETKVKDDDLKQLAGLKNLRSLSLYRTDVTDSAVDHILPLSRLEELELSYTRVTDEGISKLRNMPRLQKLFLYG
ncbi:MAG: hypothetical protein AB7O26_20425, partial [Planctomycetaceae bacterium]